MQFLKKLGLLEETLNLHRKLHDFYGEILCDFCVISAILEGSTLSTFTTEDP